MTRRAYKVRSPAPMAGLAVGTITLIITGCGSIAPPRTATADPAVVSTLNGLVRGPCNQAVASVMAGEGIPISEIRAAIYSEIRGGPSSSVSQYDVWLYPRDQDGAVIVNLDNTCRPMQIYARGGANLQRAERRS